MPESGKRIRARDAFLARTYSDLALMRGPAGHIPAWPLRLSSAATADVDHLSIQLTERIAKIVPHPSRLEDAEEKEKRSRMWDGTTFSLSGFALDSAGAVERIEGYLGSYFRMRDTAGYLERELYATPSEEFSLDTLPARRAVLGAFASPSICLTQGGGVDGAMGGSTLVMFARDKTYDMLVAQRSAAHDRGGLYHTVPSFMYQPVAHRQRVDPLDKKISHNVFREYLEELFDVGVSDDAAALYEHPNLKYLCGLIDEGAAELRPSGLVFNLVDHRLEICTLLMIHDDDWYARQGDRSAAQRHGLAPIRASVEMGPQGVTALSIDDPSWIKILDPSNAMPMAVATIVLGTRQAHSIVGFSEPSWLAAIG